MYCNAQALSVDERTLITAVKRAVGLAITTLPLSPLTTVTHCTTEPPSNQQVRDYFITR